MTPPTTPPPPTPAQPPRPSEPPTASPQRPDADAGDGRIECSAKGCRRAATWVLVWANPRIHTAGRTKTWAACDEHRQSLGDFLGVRGFLREVVALADWQERVASQESDGQGSAGQD